MKSFKVSIILPVYNVEKYLGACLDTERLGHEKVQTTLDLYCHLSPDVHGNVPQQLQDSAAALLSPTAWQNPQKST